MPTPSATHSAGSKKKNGRKDVEDNFCRLFMLVDNKWYSIDEMERHAGCHI